jgi:beta-galactosidase
MRFTLLAVTITLAMALARREVHSQEKFTPPASPRRVYNFDTNWKFFKEDKSKASGAQAPAFDDSTWTAVSTPHTYNDVDSFRGLISHGGGDRGVWKGTAWYRKHFKLADTAKKVFLEFEGMRQAGEIFLNGKSVGNSENGVTAYGVDITNGVLFGGKDNVLAVHVDNRGEYAEKATGTRFQWNVNDFNPNYGGINRHVRLHVTGPVYQTLPLYDGLKTTGVYIYPTNISVPAHTADVTTESQVHNSSAEPTKVLLSAIVVDRDGVAQTKFQADPVEFKPGDKKVLKATGPLQKVHFWGVDDPYLYDVYTLLTVDGKVVDVNKVTTGFRKTAFKGGAGTGGVFINDEFVYLKGYAQRASNEWAGLGQAYPDWMHDFNAKLIHDQHGNYVRWMHITPQKIDSDSCDRFGIVQIAPAGDKEKVVQGRQWQQRVEVMITSMIYLRNSPSVLMWEAGNTGVPPNQMQEMVDLRKKWDPSGGRFMGCRTLNDKGTTHIAEYFGVMIGQAPQTDALFAKGPTAMFRAYSGERRDLAPFIETEDCRDEGARRFWDDFSPPYFGFKKGKDDSYGWNSETFALTSVRRYNDYWKNRIANTDPEHSKWAGYASIYFSDSNADGRQQSSEVCRVSGKVDAVRIPKPIYFAHSVMQSPNPEIHALGHWNYPEGTKKTVYAISNTKAVELRVNGKVIGKVTTPKDGFTFAFPNIKWEPGTLTVVGLNDGKEVCRHELTTVSAAKRIKLSPITGPAGLLADGGDVALIDVEVVDEAGRRCPTDDDKIDFVVTGPAIWRGGYNSGKTKSTNNLYLNTECGINRVSIRSTLEAGKITVTATRNGLEAGTVEIEARQVEWKDGFCVTPPNRLPAPTK